MLRVLFDAMGYQVVAEAGTGEAALAAYMAQRPDFVTLDISLPDINGLEVLKRIRAFDPAARVIVITGNNARALEVEALSLGALRVVLKPFNFKTFKRLFEGPGTAP
ncbi:MAG: response regulator [Elusimicrobia bacterium]|nr:response regulator [Elusimicrobiota bacterium]